MQYRKVAFSLAMAVAWLVAYGALHELAAPVWLAAFEVSQLAGFLVNLCVLAISLAPVYLAFRFRPVHSNLHVDIVAWFVAGTAWYVPVLVSAITAASPVVLDVALNSPDFRLAVLAGDALVWLLAAIPVLAVLRLLRFPLPFSAIPVMLLPFALLNLVSYAGNSFTEPRLLPVFLWSALRSLALAVGVLVAAVALFQVLPQRDR